SSSTRWSALAASALGSQSSRRARRGFQSERHRMTRPRVVILGGYGTFGRLIAEQLARSDAEGIVAGRDAVKGQAFAASLKAGFVFCDMKRKDALRGAVAGTQLVINAAGPFQAKDYSIPQLCIEQGCHYIDLGDGREYVAGIAQLDESAKAHHVFVCV